MKKIILCMILMIIFSTVIAYGQSSDSTVIQITMLNQDPNPARAGDTVNLRFKIENAGGQSVKNLDVELLQKYPFTVVSGSVLKSFSNIGAYQSGNDYVNLEYTVKIDKDTIQGQRQLQIRYKYINDVWVTLSFSVNIISKEYAQIIYVDKAKLEPGKETDMTFTIINVGSAPLQNLIFSWQEPTGAVLPVYSSDTKYVKYLDVGKSIDLTYKVIADVNAKPGLYQLNLNLKSESVTNVSTNTISTRAGIFIGGETDFDVAFSESSQGQTSLSVSNTGNNPAQSVSVKIPQQGSFRVTGTNSAIIGNLDKGDYTIVSFQIVSSGSMNFSDQRRQQFNASDSGRQQPNVTNDPNNLKVIIDYTDTTGERRSVEKSVPIQFRSSDTQGTAVSSNGIRRTQTTSSGFVGGTLFWIMIVSIIAIAGFFVFRSKRRRDKILNLLRKR